MPGKKGNTNMKTSMETYRATIEQNIVFNNHKNGHVFTRGVMLGKGGFGFVYETSIPGYTRRMVLKAIPTARISKTSQRMRINNEVKLHSLLDHENIVKLYHSFEDETAICIIIERCERSLLELLHTNNKKCKIEDVSCIGRQVLLALNYLHERHIIHRDIKLGNVLLKHDLVVKVCDFGLAKKYNPDDKPTICGTPNYLAPEVLEHKGHRPASDIWSVGCVLVVLLTGSAPFEGETTDETYDLILNSEPKLPEGEPGFINSFLKKILLKDVTKRATIQQLLQHDYITGFYDPNINAASENDNGHMMKTPSKTLTNKMDNSYDETSPCKTLLVYDIFNTSIVIKSYTLQETDYLWIQCWIDYTNKDCGFAYRLSNDIIGVKLKSNKISYILKKILSPRYQKEVNSGLKNNSFIKAKFEYYSESRNKLIVFHDDNDIDMKTDDRFRKHVEEMKNLINYYDEYMCANLINHYTNNKLNLTKLSNENEICRIRLIDWRKNKYYVAMVLSNFTIQVNFFMTHYKVIIQGQFSDRQGWFLPIPLTPQKSNLDAKKSDMNVISKSRFDGKQPFRVYFVNSARQSFLLNNTVLIALLRKGPKQFGSQMTNEIGCTPEELYSTLKQTHQAMHDLTVFSKRCYPESTLCNALACRSQNKTTWTDNIINPINKITGLTNKTNSRLAGPEQVENLLKNTRTQKLAPKLPENNGMKIDLTPKKNDWTTTDKLHIRQSCPGPLQDLRGNNYNLRPNITRHGYV